MKDYEAIAIAFRSLTYTPQPQAEDAWQDGYEAGRVHAAKAIAAVLRLDNPDFNAARFYTVANID